jgi:protoporphyrinogen oxidase
MAGYGAWHRLSEAGLDPVIYDRNSYHGGHTASHRTDGFIFDEGPHVSFTSDPGVKELLAEAIGGRHESIDARISNYYRGHWIRHPAITNLHGLPAALVTEILADFVRRPAGSAQVHNYEEWLVASYGRRFAETFPMQYTRKYHTTEAANLSTEWVGPRLYQAKLEEVLLGALTPDVPNVHYVQDYRYPSHDGFVAYLGRFRQRANIVLEHEVTAIEPRSRQVQFANGVTTGYDHLISSVPLPDLIGLIRGAPRDVVEAAGTLACTALVLVNLGVARPDVADASWLYFYDDEFPFSRVSFPRTFSPHTVPEGCSAIQSEVYFSKKYRPLEVPPEACIDPVIAGLQACGILRPDDRIVLRQAMLVPYANIIFDLDRIPALGTVHGYLDDVGIRYCGRYGDWGYLWTDQAFRSGERAAQQVLDGAGGRG